MIGTFLCRTPLHLSWGFRVSATHNKELYFLQNKPSLLILRYISSNSNQQHSFTVSYLMNSCGLSPESALLASKLVKFETPEKPDSVLTLFNNHGFSKTHIAKIVRKYPSVLLSNPEKTLLPKFNFFYSKGFSSPELADTLSSNPSMLRISLESRLIPNFQLLRGLLQSDQKTIAAIKRFSTILGFNLSTYLAPNVDILRDSGVPEANIMFLLTYQPGVFMSTCDKLRETVEEVKKMGFNPLRTNFVIAFKTLRGLSKLTWERKMEVYKRWGWSEEETLQAFGKYPKCMAYSEDKIMVAMDYFVNIMGRKSSLFARQPLLIGLSFDKRIVPRCSVIQVLLSKGLIKKDFNISGMLKSSEKMFVHKFVTCYKDEVPQLLKLYQEKWVFKLYGYCYEGRSGIRDAVVVKCLRLKRIDSHFPCCGT